MLTGKQKSILKRLANNEQTSIHIGKSGVDDTMIKLFDDCLTARELVKAIVLKNCENTPEEAAQIIGDATESDVVQVIGKKFILFRKSEKTEKQKISLLI